MKRWAILCFALLLCLVLAMNCFGILAEEIAIESVSDVAGNDVALDEVDLGLEYLPEELDLEEGELALSEDLFADNVDAGLPHEDALVNNSDEKNSNDDFEIEDGTLVKYKGQDADVVIPDGVTAIGTNAFYCTSDESSIRSVKIPWGVISIGDFSFFGNTGLKTVTIPDSVTTIGEYSFTDCTGLESATVPSSVKSIGSCAFHYYSIDDHSYFALPKLTIYGKAGSYVEEYAGEYYIPFSVISDTTVAPTVKPTATPTVKPTATPTVKPTATPAPTPTVKPRTSLSKAKITVKAQVYSGKAKKPAVTVKLGSVTLKKGTDYTVSYKNNTSIGTASVTVTGKGKYKGTAKATFKIVPKAVTGMTLKAGSNQLTVSWKKNAGVTGYQLQYGLKSDFSSAKKVSVKKASTLKKVLKGLKKGRYYYVRIRAWKTVKEKNYWSAWSAKARAKVK